MFHFAIAKIGIHLTECFLLSEIFCLWIWHAIAKRYNWWLLPQNIWNKSNNNLICTSNNLTAASLKRKYWSVGLSWKLVSKLWSWATLHRNSRANFVAQQLTSKGRQHRGHTWAKFELKMKSEQWAGSRSHALIIMSKGRPRPAPSVYPWIP